MKNVPFRFRKLLMMIAIVGSLTLPDDVMGQVTSFDNNCPNGANATADCSAAIGDNAAASADYSVAIGTSSVASATDAVSIAGTASGVSALSFGGSATGVSSVAIGKSTASGPGALSIGANAIAYGDDSYAFGEQVKSSATNAMVFGRGISGVSPLDNGDASTLMLGMNSNVPTFYMSDAGGSSGAFSNIGIATTLPSSRLHVNGDVRLGVASSTIGRTVWHNGTNTNSVTLESGTTTSSYTLKLPVAIGSTTPSGTLDVNGTVVINYASLLAGNPLGGGPPATDFMLGVNTSGQLLNMGASSAQFKENIEDIDFDKEAFLNLRPVNFRWKEVHGGYNDVGLVAQEVNESFPALASWTYRHTYLDNGDFLRDSLGIPVVDTTQMEVGGVRYHKLPVYLLAIAKDQQAELNELRQQVQQLSDQINSCCVEVQPMERLDNSPTLNDKAKMDEFILLKNDPNPFSDYTDIYYEHNGCVSCEVIISDNTGRVLKRIRTSGSIGTVRVYSSEIGAGLFLYSLVKDGNTVLTGQMVSSNR